MLAFASLLVWISFPQEDLTEPLDLAKSAILVSVVETVPADFSFKIDATGITQAKWRTNIAATVDGRVAMMADMAQPGRLVKQGELLARIDNTLQKQAFAASKAQLAEAELALAQAQREQQLAKQHGNSKTAYGRHEPQVKAAQANFDAATASMEVAKQRLADTEVTAPFDAVIIRQLISPHLWVSSGDVLYELAASNAVDIEVELSAEQWRRLGLHAGEEPVTIVDPSGKTWGAQVRYLSPVMARATRQRGLTLEVLNPYATDTPLLPDQQVMVSMSAKTQADVVQAPASVLTEDGKVWSLEDGVLKLEDIELLFERPDHIFFRYLRDPARRRSLALFPLSSMLVGQAATARPSGQ